MRRAQIAAASRGDVDFDGAVDVMMRITMRVNRVKRVVMIMINMMLVVIMAAIDALGLLPGVRGVRWDPKRARMPYG